MLTNVCMQMNDPHLRYFICSLGTRAVRRMVAYYNKALAPMGLTAQQVMALGVLWQEDGLSLGEFARRAGMGKASAVAMVRRLERMALLTSAPDPEDARLNVLNLTQKAKNMAPEVLAMGTALEENIEKAVGKEDMAAMIRGLAVIRDLDI